MEAAGPDTRSWYTTNYGCLRTDPTRIARLHTFPDAVIPRGFPEDPAAPAKICSDSVNPITSMGAGSTEYKTAWPQRYVDPSAMIDAYEQHPQFAFRAGGPATAYQIGVESQLRRLDQPLSKCQAVIAEDAPLFRNTVAPPPVSGIDEGVQNAANPVAAMVRRVGPEQRRREPDKVACEMYGCRRKNPTRQDTMRMDKPFDPPGIGSGEARPASKGPYYA